MPVKKDDKTKRKAGRPVGSGIRYNAEFAKEIRGAAAAGATQEMIAKAYDLSVSTLVKLYGKDYEQGKARALLKAGGEAYRRAMGTDKRPGSDVMLIFYLKTQGRWKESQEVEITDMTPPSLVLNFNAAGDNEK